MEDNVISKEDFINLTVKIFNKTAFAEFDDKEINKQFPTEKTNYNTTRVKKTTKK